MSASRLFRPKSLGVRGRFRHNRDKGMPKANNEPKPFRLRGWFVCCCLGAICAVSALWLFRPSIRGCKCRHLRLVSGLLTRHSIPRERHVKTTERQTTTKTSTTTDNLQFRNRVEGHTWFGGVEFHQRFFTPGPTPSPPYIHPHFSFLVFLSLSSETELSVVSYE